MMKCLRDQFLLGNYARYCYCADQLFDITHD